MITKGGYKVYTTVDIGMNEMVESAIREQISKLGANNVTNGAVVVLKPITGEILAMVGSADYDNEAIDGSFNVTWACASRAARSKRSPMRQRWNAG